MRYRLLASYQGAHYEVGIGPAESDVVLFAALPPPEELGFEPATGHWRKQVHLAEVQALRESRPVGRFRGEQCAILDDLGDRLHIAYLGHDAFLAEKLGYWEVDRGVFELIAPRQDVTDVIEQQLPFPGRPATTDGHGLARSSAPANGHTAAQFPPQAPGLAVPPQPAPGQTGPGQTGPGQTGPQVPMPGAARQQPQMPRVQPAPYPVPAPGTLGQLTQFPQNQFPPVQETPPGQAPPGTVAQGLAQPEPSLAQPSLAQPSLAQPGQIQPGWVPPDRAPVSQVPQPLQPLPPPMMPAQFGAPLTHLPPEPGPQPTFIANAGPNVAVPPIEEPPLPLEAQALRATRREQQEQAPEPGALPAPDSVAGLSPGLIAPPEPAAPPVHSATGRISYAAAAAAAEAAAAAAIAAVGLPLPAPAPPAGSAALANSAAPVGPAPVGPAPAGPAPAGPAPVGPAPAGPALASIGHAGQDAPPPTAEPPLNGHAGVGPVAVDTPLPASRRRRAARKRLPTQRIFSDLAAQAGIPSAAYAIGEDTDGAMCLLRTDDGFEVFNSAAGARHEVRVFQDEESAYFYLFGVLVADAVRTGALAPR